MCNQKDSVADRFRSFYRFLPFWGKQIVFPRHDFNFTFITISVMREVSVHGWTCALLVTNMAIINSEMSILPTCCIIIATFPNSIHISHAKETKKNLLFGSKIKAAIWENKLKETKRKLKWFVMDGFWLTCESNRVSTRSNSSLF